MNIFKRKPKEYIISYKIISEKFGINSIGHTVRKEKGKILDYGDWIDTTTEHWNKEYGINDIVIVITNIFLNK